MTMMDILHSAPATRGAGPWLGPPSQKWVPAERAAQRSGGAAPLARRLEQELFLPALRSSSADEFIQFTLKSLPAFEELLMALAFCGQAETKAVPVDGFSRWLGQQAAAFGGDAWEDAALGGHADVVRALDLSRRLVLAYPNDGEVLLAQQRANNLIMLWAWCVNCFVTVLAHHDGISVHADVLEAIRDGIQTSAQQAYAAVRTLELERRQKAQQAASAQERLPSLEGALTDEEKALEAEAEAESQRLLNQMGAH